MWETAIGVDVYVIVVVIIVVVDVVNGYVDHVAVVRLRRAMNKKPRLLLGGYGS